MNLYLVHFDDTPYYVEAPSFPAAGGRGVNVVATYVHDECGGFAPADTAARAMVQRLNAMDLARAGMGIE